MVLTLVVTIISVIIIFVDAGRWTHVRSNFHAALIVVSAKVSYLNLQSCID